MTASASRCIILAAGQGTRLRPYTDSVPKCLVPVAGRPLLEYQLEVLHAAGVDDVVVVAGYLADRITQPGVRVHLNPRFAETNMVWTLFCAEREMDQELVLAYGDIAYSPRVLAALLSCPGDVAVVVDRQWEAYWRQRFDDPLADAETLRIEQGRIVEIGQKPKTLREIEAQYIGLMKFTPAGLDALKRLFHDACRAGALAGKPPERAYMTDLLQALADSGQDITAVPVDGEWIEIDSARDLDVAVSGGRLARILAP